MKSSSHNFKSNAQKALNDDQLQKALENVETGFIKKRALAREKLAEFDKLSSEGRAIKDHTLKNLDLYLDAYEKKVLSHGGHVHWAEDSEEACKIIIGLCKKTDAKSVTKGKSMISEEIALNKALEENNIEAVETDLGEYIIQLRAEHPSHIIAPAVHLNKEQVEADFRKAHTNLPDDRPLDTAAQLVGEARAMLRQKYLDAEVGITGANFLIAETGTSVIVTNEGNGDLTQIFPKTHIVIASLEKIIPTLEDASTLIRLLARSATGQDISTYTTFSTGPRRTNDPDGPENYHVIILDNGRSNMLGNEFSDMLRCIRCGACMNHCPVYHAVGGHAYGWVYPGPMGSVLTPSLIGVDEAGHLPNASTFCGRCEEVCPMQIPLPKMMRHWREREFAQHLPPKVARYGLGLWRFVASRPKLYRALTGGSIKMLKILAGRKGHLKKYFFSDGWTKHRDLPAPEGSTFMQQYAKRKGR